MESSPESKSEFASRIHATVSTAYADHVRTRQRNNLEPQMTFEQFKTAYAAGVRNTLKLFKPTS